jgi:hypothetical protein
MEEVPVTSGKLKPDGGRRQRARAPYRFGGEDDRGLSEIDCDEDRHIDKDRN